MGSVALAHQEESIDSATPPASNRISEENLGDAERTGEEAAGAGPGCGRLPVGGCVGLGQEGQWICSLGLREHSTISWVA